MVNTICIQLKLLQCSILQCSVRALQCVCPAQKCMVANLTVRAHDKIATWQIRTGANLPCRGYFSEPHCTALHFYWCIVLPFCTRQLIAAFSAHCVVTAHSSKHSAKCCTKRSAVLYKVLCNVLCSVVQSAVQRAVPSCTKFKLQGKTCSLEPTESI